MKTRLNIAFITLLISHFIEKSKLLIYRGNQDYSKIAKKLEE